MKKTKFTLLAPLTAVVILSGCANLTHVGKINDTEITTLTTRGVFSPSSRTVFGHVPGQPGVEVLATASGPGFVPAVATAGGIAGGAALLRPARTSVSNSSSNKASSDNDGTVSATSVNDMPITVTVPGKNTPPSPPPGHVNNPSGNQ